MNLIDSHCHLDFDAFEPDRDQVVESARNAGVNTIIIPGVKAEQWTKQLSVAQQYGFPYALGLHPYFVDEHETDDLGRLEDAVVKHRPIAVGEIGLDFYDRNLDRDKQVSIFTEQVKLANQHQLPVIIHARKSHDEILKILKLTGFLHGGIIHAFNGSLQQAEQFIDLGFKLGFGGMMTYEKSSHLRSLAKQLTLQAIVTETDAPDMSGAAHYGQRNSPAYIPEVITTLSSIREITTDEVAKQVLGNVSEIFPGLSLLQK